MRHLFLDDPDEYQKIKAKRRLYEGECIDRNHLSNKEKVVEIKEMVFNIIAKIW
jgi:hypothetical protein